MVYNGQQNPRENGALTFGKNTKNENQKIMETKP